MPRIDVNSNPFGGRISAVPWQRQYDSLDCRRCGSSLVGRREAVERTTTRGIRLVVETFRCRCGRGRRIERQEVGA